MVKAFIKLKEEPSSGLKPDSRDVGKGTGGVRAKKNNQVCCLWPLRAVSISSQGPLPSLSLLTLP